MHSTMLLSDPPCSRLASTGTEELRKMKKQPNAGQVDQLQTKESEPASHTAWNVQTPHAVKTFLQKSSHFQGLVQ